MIPMRMMQTPTHEIVDVIAVRDRLMTTSLAMGMIAVPAARRRVTVGVLGVDLHHVLVDMIVVRMMKMAVVEIVDMVAMLDRDMAAIGPVNVRMLRMNRVISHSQDFDRSRSQPQTAGSKKHSR
jgi:hypothetical protein